VPACSAAGDEYAEICQVKNLSGGMELGLSGVHGTTSRKTKAGPHSTSLRAGFRLR
jgi:hypothetical protein